MSENLFTMQAVDLNLSIMPSIEAQTVESLRHARPAFLGGRKAGCVSSLHLDETQVQQAVDRFQRFAPLLKTLFPELQATAGRIESDLLAVPQMQQALGLPEAMGQMWVKADHSLPVAGSVKARGVEVVEHKGDYAQAVAAGRALAEQDPHCHFVDDEHSLSLLLGYAASAPYLVAQLAEHKRVVDETHPLFVYIPCGVGGAPGGVALGLQQAFGANVHCFFAEPVQSPCFMVEMLAGTAALPGMAQHPSVYELGLNNQTEADGLAVPAASELAADVVRGFLGGVFTVEDETLFRHLALLQQTEDLQIEPSAAAGFSGPCALLESAAGQDYLQRQNLLPHMGNATHIVWTTGGLFVPDEEYAKFLARGQKLQQGA